MELFATVLMAIGLFFIVAIQLVAMFFSFSQGIGEVLRVFLIPGYALWMACTDETWARWTVGIGASFILLALLLHTFF